MVFFLFFIVALIVLGYMGDIAEVMGTAAGSNPNRKSDSDSASGCGCVLLMTVVFIGVPILMGAWDVLPWMIGLCVVMWIAIACGQG
jgi:hypothetical protein